MVEDLLSIGNDLGVVYGLSNNPQWAINSFGFEKEVREKWWKIQAGDVVFDVGAGWGSYVLPAALAGAAVVAFEPGRNEFFDLYTNVFLNGFNNVCSLWPILLGNVVGSTDYFLSSYSARFSSPEEIPERRVITTLDRMASHVSISKVDWIKIDTEGYELEVLQGAEDTIKRFHPILIIENHVEFVPGIDEQARQLLIPWGYKEESFVGGGGNENWSKWTHQS